jgi:hypothetical protein
MQQNAYGYNLRVSSPHILSHIGINNLNVVMEITNMKEEHGIHIALTMW